MDRLSSTAPGALVKCSFLAGTFAHREAMRRVRTAVEDPEEVPSGVPDPELRSSFLLLAFFFFPNGFPFPSFPSSASASTLMPAALRSFFIRDRVASSLSSISSWRCRKKTAAPMIRTIKMARKMDVMMIAFCWNHTLLLGGCQEEGMPVGKEAGKVKWWVPVP